MNTVIYILFALSILNFIMLIACVLRFKDDFGIFDSVTKSQAQIYKESLKETFENYKKIIDVMTNMHSMVDLMTSQYKDIYEMSKHELDAYRKMYDLHKSLLEAVKDIDQQYSVTCEQFEEIGKGQADIYAKITELRETLLEKTDNYCDFESDGIYWNPDNKRIFSLEDEDYLSTNEPFEEEDEKDDV